MPKSLVWPRVIPNLRYMDRTYLGVIEIFFTFFFMKTQCLTLEFKLHYNILLTTDVCADGFEPST